MSEKSLFKKFISAYKIANKKIIVSTKFKNWLSDFVGADLDVNNISSWAEINKHADLDKFVENKPQEGSSFYYGKFFPNGQFPSHNLRFKAFDPSSAFLIYADKQSEIEGFTIKKEIFLKGAGSIPNLFLYLVSRDSSRMDYLSDFDKDNAHYFFIIPILNELFSSFRNDNFFEKNINDFISNNKEKLNNVRRLFSNQNPEILGSGIEGIVIKLSDTLVAKFFTNKNLYNNALVSIKNLHENKNLAHTEPMIYDTGEIGSFYGKKIYYYVMELMKPATKLKKDMQLVLLDISNVVANKISTDVTLAKMRAALNFSESKSLDDYKTEIYKSVDEITSILNRQYQRKISYIKNSLSLKDNWEKSFVLEMVVKFLANKLDLRIPNLGVTSYNDLKYFDPYFDGFAKKKNIRTTNLFKKTEDDFAPADEPNDDLDGEILDSDKTKFRQ